MWPRHCVGRSVCVGSNEIPPSGRCQTGDNDTSTICKSIITITSTNTGQVQGHQKFRLKTIEFPLSKKQTKWPIELLTLKQEMETDDDDATIRESFSLVQSILFIEFTDAPPAH